MFVSSPGLPASRSKYKSESCVRNMWRGSRGSWSWVRENHRGRQRASEKTPESRETNTSEEQTHWGALSLHSCSPHDAEEPNNRTHVLAKQIWMNKNNQREQQVLGERIRPGLSYVAPALELQIWHIAFKLRLAEHDALTFFAGSISNM